MTEQEEAFRRMTVEINRLRVSMAECKELFRSQATILKAMTNVLKLFSDRLDKLERGFE